MGSEAERITDLVDYHKRVAKQCGDSGFRSQQGKDLTHATRLERFALPLAEEVDRLRELVGRFVRNASNGRELAPRWVSMMTATTHGSTVASALCVEFGVDPAEDAGVRQPYPGEECPFCGEECDG